MCRPTCPFASALLGLIAGSAAGATIGSITGWILYAIYAKSGGAVAQGLALLIFGTLGMGIGASSGAAGGMVEGWGLGQGRGPAELSSTRWGASLGAFWVIQPILWLAFRLDLTDALLLGLAITLAVVALGGVAGLAGGLTARKVVRVFGLVRASAVPAPGRINDRAEQTIGDSETRSGGTPGRSAFLRTRR